MSQSLITTAGSTRGDVPRFGGLRMTAEDFFQLPDDGHDYELLDGVVIMTPSPSPRHQQVAGEILFQLQAFLKQNPVGKAFHETDVYLGQPRHQGDLVYRPEIVFYRADRLAGLENRLIGPPDLVVEVISPPSRLYDTKTKRDDYEHCGVVEYWIIDPQADAFTFLFNEAGSFVPVVPVGDRFASRVIQGFMLDLAEVRKTFQW